MQHLRSHLPALLLGLVVLVGIGIYAFQKPEVLPPPDTKDTSAARAYILQEIDTHGGPGAYAALKKTYANEDFEVRHLVAHLFGEAIYEELGLAGIRVCDTDFNFGCYHGFFTRAVVTEGMDVVPQLDAECRAAELRAVTACQHGIGHGILEFFGHTKLVEALEACKMTQQPDPLAGCTSGVFMEYNVPLTVTEEGAYRTQARSMLDPNDPYAPCPTLAPLVQSSCYYEMAQWWKQIYGDDFKKMGELCDALPDAYNSSSCFGGIGKIIPSSSHYDIDTMLAACNALPTEKSRSSCILVSTFTLSANNGDYERAAIMCSHANEEDRKLCQRP